MASSQFRVNNLNAAPITPLDVGPTIEYRPPMALALPRNT